MIGVGGEIGGRTGCVGGVGVSGAGGVEVGEERARSNSQVLVVGLHVEPSQHGDKIRQRSPAAVQVPDAEVIVFKTSFGLGMGGVGGRTLLSVFESPPVSCVAVGGFTGVETSAT